MEDVVVNLHGDDHRQRRRLENRLFRRDTFYEYEREMFPAIIQQTVNPYLRKGKELVGLRSSTYDEFSCTNSRC